MPLRGTGLEIFIKKMAGSCLRRRLAGRAKMFHTWKRSRRNQGKVWPGVFFLLCKRFAAAYAPNSSLTTFRKPFITVSTISLPFSGLELREVDGAPRPG